jgi:large subunit ribosomal protein L17
MRHRLSGRHLGRETSHRVALYRNLVTDLLRYERITTTEAKAKEIRPMAEKIITLGRRGDLHARRQALSFLYDPRVAKKVFDDIAPRMANRPGGYLRITGLEPRKGDGAKMAVIELVDYVDVPATPRPQRVTASPTATPSPASTRSATTTVAEPEVAAEPEPSGVQLASDDVDAEASPETTDIVETERAGEAETVDEQPPEAEVHPATDTADEEEARGEE